MVRLTARRADVLVVPSTAMAERVCHALPAARNRLVVRAHPVSANSIPVRPRAIQPSCARSCSRPTSGWTSGFRNSSPRSTTAENRWSGSGLQQAPVIFQTGSQSEPRIEFLGRIDQHALREAWARSQAIYFPTGLESFGYPLAEARVSGHPVIARDTAQNQEIAGSALCGFSPGDPDSLRHALKLALTSDVSPDPGTF